MRRKNEGKIINAIFPFKLNIKNLEREIGEMKYYKL